jgi:hypothetical protein
MHEQPSFNSFSKSPRLEKVESAHLPRKTSRFADADGDHVIRLGVSIRRQSHLLLHGLANRTPSPVAAGVLREVVMVSP